MRSHAWLQGNNFLARLSGALGTSALCLSGGGALAMYHMGVVDVLISAGVCAGEPIRKGLPR
jgi:predicted acylesterase/phospholipase RssA